MHVSARGEHHVKDAERHARLLRGIARTAPRFYVAEPTFAIGQLREALQYRTTLRRSALDLRRQPLGHLDLRGVIDCPGRLVGDGFDEAGGGGMAVAALLDAAERQMDLGADAG